MVFDIFATLMKFAKSQRRMKSRWKSRGAVLGGFKYSRRMNCLLTSLVFFWRAKKILNFDISVRAKCYSGGV